MTTHRLLYVRRGDFFVATTPIVATATLLVPMAIHCETQEYLRSPQDPR